MKRISRMFMVLIALSLAGVAGPARAYYDDVHFALTYYIARQVGYTPEQASRVAKADVSIDYSYRTEPVQMGSVSGFLSSEWGSAYAADPRWRFHAFRNQIKFPQSVDNGAQAADADRMINETQVWLWKQAIEDRNPGVFLHFLQDKVPHARYGSAFGHWPLDSQDDTDAHQRMQLTIGGSTDWLSFRDEQSNLEMVRTSFEALSQYLRHISPGQTPRAFDPNAFIDLLRAMRQANPVPPPLAGKTLRALIQLKLGLSTQPGLRSAMDDDFRDAIGAEENVLLAQHAGGPEIAYALRDIDKLMAQQHWSVDGGVPYETIPSPPSEINRYDFDSLGRLKNSDDVDRYVLTGSMQVKLRQSGGHADTDAAAQVTVRLAKTRREDPELLLAGPTSAAINGDALRIDNLPIGELIVEVSRPGQASVVETWKLVKALETMPIDLPAVAEATATSTLPAELESARSRLNDLLTQLRGQRDQAVQRFEAALAAVRSQLAPPAPSDAQGAAALCARIDAADLSLTATLAQLAAAQDQIETALPQAQQRAGRCTDAADLSAAEAQLQQARGLAHGIDQQVTALALLAVQLGELEAQRQQRLAQRGAAGAAGSAANAAGAAAAAVDFAELDAAWSELQRFDRAWSSAAAAPERLALEPLATAIAAVLEPPREPLRAGLTRLHALIDEIAALGLEPRDLQQRAGQLAALRAAAAATPHPASNPPRARDVPAAAAADADACLARAPIDIGAGLEQAHTNHFLAQLALDKLGGALEAQLASCRAKLATALDPAAAVAAKHCRYPGSEAYWDASQLRPMCRCPAGQQWNADRSACVDARAAQLAQADCSRFANTEPSWSDTEHHVVCSCVGGHQWAQDRKSCVPNQATQLAQQRCDAPHSEPYWDAPSGSAGCRCASGYVYTEIFKECEIDWKAQVGAADCSAYDHAEAYWDAGNSRAACRCVDGYKSDPVAHTCTADVAALLAAADCSDWPDSAPQWDAEHGKVQCRCRTGTRFNSRSQACERDIDALLANTNCSRWPNSAPIWDQDKQEVRCECIQGTHFNADNARCERALSPDEQVAALDCAEHANTEAYWDAGEQRPLCRCREGYQNDGYGNGCAAVPVVIACDTASKSGANPPETVTVEIGSAVGIAQFHYQMFTVPDRMVVEYSGQVVADTGCIGGSSSIPIDLSGYGSQVVIHVTPNCRGDDDTEWNFTLSCPQ